MCATRRTRLRRGQSRSWPDYHQQLVHFAMKKAGSGQSGLDSSESPRRVRELNSTRGTIAAQYARSTGRLPKGSRRCRERQREQRRNDRTTNPNNQSRCVSLPPI